MNYDTGNLVGSTGYDDRMMQTDKGSTSTSPQFYDGQQRMNDANVYGRQQYPNSYTGGLDYANGQSSSQYGNGGYVFPLVPHDQNIAKTSARNKAKMLVLVLAITILAIFPEIRDGELVNAGMMLIFLLVIMASFIVAYRFMAVDYGKPTISDNVLEISIGQIREQYPQIAGLLDKPVKVSFANDDYGGRRASSPQSGHGIDYIWFKAPSDGCIHEYRLYAVLKNTALGKMMDYSSRDPNRARMAILQVAPDGSANIIIDYNAGFFNNRNAAEDKNIRYMLQYTAIELTDTYYAGGAAEFRERNNSKILEDKRRGLRLPAGIIAFTVLWFTVTGHVDVYSTDSGAAFTGLIGFSFALAIAFGLSVLSLIARIINYIETKKEIDRRDRR